MDKYVGILPGWHGFSSHGLTFSQSKPFPVNPGGQGPHLSSSRHSTLVAHLQLIGWLHNGPAIKMCWMKITKVRCNWGTNSKVHIHDLKLLVDIYQEISSIFIYGVEKNKGDFWWENQAQN